MKTYNLKINGKEYEVSIDRGEGAKVAVTVNGVAYDVQVEGSASASGAASAPAAGVSGGASTPYLAPTGTSGAGATANATGASDGTSTPYKVPAGAPGAGAQGAQGGEGVKVPSPLPGVIIEVSVKEGQQVAAGQKVAVREAMKLENEISAP